MEDALTREKAEMEMANTRIIWQNDSVFVFPQQGADRIEINVPIPGPGTYAVSASVKMLPNDASLDPRMTVYFYRDNGTVPGDRIRFPDTRYTLRTGEPKIYRTERSLDSTNYTHIKGYIANYSNADTLFRRNMVVTSIKVTKKNSNR
jgi:hypothetical protein